MSQQQQQPQFQQGTRPPWEQSTWAKQSVPTPAWRQPPPVQQQPFPNSNSFQPSPFQPQVAPSFASKPVSSFQPSAFSPQQSSAPFQPQQPHQPVYQQTSYGQPSYSGYPGTIPGQPMPGQQASPSEDDEFANEPPLLEELGIDPLSVLDNLKSTLLMKEMKTVDLTGPIMVLFSLVFLLALSGKYHINHLYSLSLLGSLFTYALINVMNSKGIEFYSVVSVLGYGLNPGILLLAAINVVTNLKTPVGAVLCFLVVVSSTLHATRNFSSNLDLKNQRFLVAYPIALIYMAFAIIVVL
jgi:protein YIPF5/7